MKKFIISLYLVTLLLLSGCTTINPFTRQTEISYMAIGAGVCGGAGALIGGLISQDWSGALIGGASGAALCGGIGYYLDSQEAKLRKALDATGVSVIREGDTIRLVMPGHILFDTNIDRVNPSFFPVLDSIRDVLQEYDETGIHSQGHTDNRGSAGYNLQLSKRRAASVADYLVYQGIASNRILVLGFGETRPIADNATDKGRSLNRRVELLIKPRQ
jgi:outer membrane protein OmpA-like peptidoglycan-associated protein